MHKSCTERATRNYHTLLLTISPGGPVKPMGPIGPVTPGGPGGPYNHRAEISNIYCSQANTAVQFTADSRLFEYLTITTLLVHYAFYSV